MCPAVVVVVAPRGQFAPDFGHGTEYLRVQALVSQLTVETLNEGVLGWLPWPNEGQVNGSGVRPASITLTANSLPLSTVIDVGLPRSRTAISRASATSLPFSLGLPLMATHSLVN